NRAAAAAMVRPTYSRHLPAKALAGYHTAGSRRVRRTRKPYHRFGPTFPQIRGSDRATSSSPAATNKLRRRVMASPQKKDNLAWRVFRLGGIGIYGEG